MKKTYLNLDYVLLLTFASMTVAEASDHTDNLFTAYKSLLAKSHFQGGLTKEDNRLLSAIGDAAIAGAKHVNAQTKLCLFRTDLPTIKEAFARECDENQPLDAELCEMVNGTKGATPVDSEGTPAATSNGTEGASVPLGATPGSTVEQPAIADASGEAAKPKRKGRLDDQTVAEIRELLATGKDDKGNPIKQGEIAKKYGIDPSTVSDIKVGRGRYGKPAIEGAAPQAADGQGVPSGNVDPAKQGQPKAADAPPAAAPEESF